MSIIIRGRVISKKNNHAGGNNRFFITSKRYKEFETDALWQIKGKKLSSQTNIRLVFNMKGRLDTDLDNMITSVIDVLQKGGLIVNDKTLIHIDAYKEYGATNFYTEII